MNQKTFMRYTFGIAGALIYTGLVISSGALPYALAGGGLASGATFFLSREWPITLAVGGAVALTVSAIGVGLMLSAGGRRDNPSPLLPVSS